MLPENYSPVEHIQDVIKRIANRDIREWFADLGGDEWEPDISTSRGSLRVACTHQEGDTIDMTILRLYTFDFAVRQFFRQPVYGIPVSGFDSSRKYLPQIHMYFQEDPQDVETGYPPIDGEISFRWTEETPESITEAKAIVIANKIKTEFGGSGGYVWRKGKGMFSYADWKKGYQFQLLVRGEADGRAIVSKTLDIRGHTPDWSKASYSENLEASSAYPSIPPMERVYGKTRRVPRRRPVGDVRFRYATLSIQGLPNPIPLVDTSGTFRETLATTD